MKQLIIEETENQLMEYVKKEIDDPLAILDITTSGCLVLDSEYICDDIDCLEEFKVDHQNKYDIPTQVIFNRVISNCIEIIKKVEILIYDLKKQG
ncbi:hypothetical protein [Tissierella pigra]|uniref:Uncharacterized protein n=1 Tax=Tissierella pigra TaxID=2607614 RepID=A0A6N7XNN0_9FIRM|nr:hypothetical protein [Tissierella pigra]MSU03106.1 hypothetical protein [Tissierella pigra]